MKQLNWCSSFPLPQKVSEKGEVVCISLRSTTTMKINSPVCSWQHWLSCYFKSLGEFPLQELMWWVLISVARPGHSRNCRATNSWRHWGVVPSKGPRERQGSCKVPAPSIYQEPYWKCAFLLSNVLLSTLTLLWQQDSKKPMFHGSAVLYNQVLTHACHRSRPDSPFSGLVSEILGTRQASEWIHDLEESGVPVREGPQDPAVPADSSSIHRGWYVHTHLVITSQAST